MRIRPLILALTLLVAPIVGYAASQSLTVAPGDTWKVVSNGTPGLLIQDATPIAGALVSGRYDAAPSTLEGVPICPDHDATKWHPLVKRDAANKIVCTYTHTHYDDPHTLDGVFGNVGAWYGAGAQEISYPWQTSSGLGPENVAKHNMYKWETIQVGTCKPTSSGQLGPDAVRVEAHADGNAGAAVRYHSFALEARTCDPADASYHGTIRTGGWMDYGCLHLTQVGGPLPDGPLIEVPLLNDPIPCTPQGARRSHAAVGHTRYASVWYGRSGIVNIFGLLKEDWGPVDPNEPSKPLFYGPGLNGSTMDPVHLLAFQPTTAQDASDGTTDGMVNIAGYTDRYGAWVASGCTAPALDCVPLQMSNVKVGYYQFRADVNGIQLRDYDVQSPVTQKSLIRYPN